ncbi:MAG: acylphosphatase [Acidimicrobiales bacterium]
MSNPSVAVHLYVSGHVQGVWFRESCRQVAVDAGVSGWVRNLDDGRVEVWLEGTREGVGAVAAWCRSGPPRAMVTDVELTDVAPAGVHGFGVG